jgi:hypothetical protein
MLLAKGGDPSYRQRTEDQRNGPWASLVAITERTSTCHRDTIAAVRAPSPPARGAIRKLCSGSAMATKNDFTEPEWEALQKGITGSGMLASISDRDLTDSFGEAGAMAKYLAGQQVAGSSDFIREVAKTRGTGFGLTTSPDRVRDETMQALRSSIATLQAKAPTEVEPYRQLVLGLAQAVADAKGGEVPVETAVIEQIREALGAG